MWSRTIVATTRRQQRANASQVTSRIITATNHVPTQMEQQQQHRPYVVLASPHHQRHDKLHNVSRSNNLYFITANCRSPPYDDEQRRYFAKRKRRNNRRRSRVVQEQLEQQKQQQQEETNASAMNDTNNNTTSDDEPQKAPATFANTRPKYTIPNHETEQRLANIQDKVQDAYRSGSYKSGLKHAESYLKEVKKHFIDQEMADESNARLQKKKYDHPAIASAHNDVGLFHKLLGQFDQSRAEYKAALEIYKRTVGVDHASYASLLHNLGNLNRIQIHLDGDLRGVDRLTLMEEAADSLRMAYLIRRDERGPEHPHSVASRSSWGATLAMQILQHFKVSSVNATTTTANEKNQTKKQYVATKPISEEQWQVAEDHLRAALITAVETPRGRTMNGGKASLNTPSLVPENQKSANHDQEIKTTIHNLRIQTLSAASAAQNLAIFLKARGTTTMPVEYNPAVDDVEEEAEDENQEGKADANAQKSEDAGDTTNKEQELDELSTSKDEGPDKGSNENAEPSEIADDSNEQVQPGIEADYDETLRIETPEIRAKKEKQDKAAAEQAFSWFEEAQELYEKTLKVRKALLPEGHADLYATQHSLAELLHAMGKNKEANALRNEIINLYDEKEGSLSANQANNNVVIDTTAVPKTKSGDAADAEASSNPSAEGTEASNDKQ